MGFDRGFAGPVLSLSQTMDTQTVGKLKEVRDDRTQLSRAILTLKERAAHLKESSDRLKEIHERPDDSWAAQKGLWGTANKTKELIQCKTDFIRDYQETGELARAIWQAYRERHADLASEVEAFIPDFTDVNQVTPELLQKAQDHFNLLRERLEKVDWPESDAMMQALFDMTTAMMRFIHEVGRQASEASRRTVDNMGRS